MFGGIPGTPYDLRFRAFGIPVRVHPVFWLTAAFLSWQGGRLDLVFVRVLCVFVAVLVHELGHALVTRMFGWSPEIVLYFFGGYATSARHSTWKDIAVSAAGPIAGFGLFVLLLIADMTVLVRGIVLDELLDDALGFSLFINLVWNVMNLLPVLPLDGGHISREFFRWLSPRRGLEHSLKLSIVASGAVAFWALYAMAHHGSVLGLDPMFLGLMFGYLCYQNYQAYQALRRGYW